MEPARMVKVSTVPFRTAFTKGPLSGASAFNTAHAAAGDAKLAVTTHSTSGTRNVLSSSEIKKPEEICICSRSSLS